MIVLLLTMAVAAPPRIAVEVDGDGYLRFSREGRMVYAKRAELMIADGRLSHSLGGSIAPALSVPPSARTLLIDLEGRVTADGRPIGRIVLASLATPRADGPFCSGSAKAIGNPGEGLFGVIRAIGARGSAAPVGVSIRVRSVAEIETDGILLGDVAEIAAPQALRARIAAVDLGRTPPIGVARGLDRIRVVARLRADGMSPEKWEIDVPAGATVVRKATRRPPDQLGEVALAFARKRLGDAAPLELRPTGSAWTLPPGPVQIEGETLTQSASQVTVGLVARLDGKVVGRRSVALGIDAGAASFRIGAIVKVRVRAGSAAVEVMGRVKQGGFVGQDIVVETREGALLTGRGVSAGLVEVKP